MPYANDSEVPAHVPAKHKAQWREVWNSVYGQEKKKGTGDKDAEGHAFAAANGVALKAMDTSRVTTGEKFEKLFQLEKFVDRDAATLLYPDLAKADPTFQGIAIGVMAAEEPDHDDEILDYFGSKPYIQAWSESQFRNSKGKSYGNVRFQHDDKRPVGKVLAPLHFDDDKRQIRIVAKVTETEAKNMLEDGTLTGFSIGGDYLKKTPLMNGYTRYIAGPSEVSVCDRPCAPSAVYEVVKGNGKGELRKFKKTESEGESFWRLAKNWSDSARAAAAGARSDKKDKQEKGKEHESTAVQHEHSAEFHSKKAGQEEQASHPRAMQAHRDAAEAHQRAAGAHHTAAWAHEPGNSNGEEAQNYREKAFDHSNVAWNKGWDARVASMGKKSEGDHMNEEQKTTLTKAIEDKFFPETPFFTKPEGAISIEQIEPTHAVVWVGDKLFKVAYKDEAGSLTVGEATRLSKAQAKKHQLDDGTPMTIAEERQETLEHPGPVPTQDATSPGTLGGVQKCASCGKAADKCSCAMKSAIDDALKAVRAQVKAANEKPAEKSAAAADLEKIEESDASLEELQKGLSALAKSLETLKKLGEPEMTNAEVAENLRKARKSVGDHLAHVTKALEMHKSAHHAMHKAADNLLAAHKATHEAHKAFHDARQVHKAAHDKAMSDCGEAIGEIHKVLGGGPETMGVEKVAGGGPESMDDFGNPNEIQHPDPEVVHSIPDVPIAPKADKAMTAADIQKAIADGIAKAMSALGKAVPAKEKELTEAEKMQKAINDGIKKGVSEVIEALGKSMEAPEAPKGPGDRSTKVPLTKSEDAGGGNNDNPTLAMTEEDWEAYRRGDQKAVKKAQACTSMKWTNVPERMMKRQMQKQN